jgi:hypothetical protein
MITEGGRAVFMVRPTQGMVDRRQQPPAPPSANPREIIAAFRAGASASALRLATYLAAVPLSPSTMRRVQGTMLPDSAPSHLGEVFLGGLLEEADQPFGSREKQYDFRPGVRAELLELTSRAEAVTALAQVADIAGIPPDHSDAFQHVLDDPLGVGVEILQRADRRFAGAASAVLSRLGAPYARLATHVDRWHGTVGDAEPPAGPLPHSPDGGGSRGPRVFLS